MQPNVGGADRVVRFLVGIALAGFMMVRGMSGPAAMVIGLVAAAMIVTATFRVCPAYRLFGFSTCATPKRGPAS